jgi:hypothetical protein
LQTSYYWLKQHLIRPVWYMESPCPQQFVLGLLCWNGHHF